MTLARRPPVNQSQRLFSIIQRLIVFLEIGAAHKERSAYRIIRTCIVYAL
uniref:Uncharacterized protein n=1 Tax=Arundo donax TaxID=35708 RepID=A0A0A8YLH1_ARUDO